MQSPCSRAVAAEGDAATRAMRIGELRRQPPAAHHPYRRDSEGCLLGLSVTLEDVTSLQETDRFKTQFIAVASASASRSATATPVAAFTRSQLRVSPVELRPSSI